MVLQPNPTLREFVLNLVGDNRTGEQYESRLVAWLRDLLSNVDTKPAKGLWLDGDANPLLVVFVRTVLRMLPDEDVLNADDMSDSIMNIPGAPLVVDQRWAARLEPGGS